MTESESDAPKQFELWRQDDHGSRFLMKTFSDPAEAEAIRKIFEDRGHHQMHEVLNKNLQLNMGAEQNPPEGFLQ